MHASFILISVVIDFPIPIRPFSTLSFCVRSLAAYQMINVKMHVGWTAWQTRKRRERQEKQQNAIFRVKTMCGNHKDAISTSAKKVKILLFFSFRWSVVNLPEQIPFSIPHSFPYILWPRVISIQNCRRCAIIESTVNTEYWICVDLVWGIEQ